MLFLSKIIKTPLDNQAGNVQMTLELHHSFQEKKKPDKKLNKKTVPAISPEEKAQLLIAQAEVRASKILEDSRSQAEQEAAQIAARARENAYRQGYQDALDKAREEAAGIRERAKKVLQQAQDEKTAVIDGLEQEIIGLSVDIAQKIIAQQLTIDPGVVTSIAKEALQLVKNRDLVIIYHHPADQESFEQQAQGLKRLLPADAGLSLIADEDIAPGGCVVETEHGRVEATLESRWQSIFESLGLAVDKHEEN